MKSKRKTIKYSDPGKILDLVVGLTAEKSADLQIAVNTYLTNECEAELIFFIIVHTNQEEAYINAIGTTVLPREAKLRVSQQLAEALKSSAELTTPLHQFDTEVQNILKTVLPKDEVKRRITTYPSLDKSYQAIVCAVAPKCNENHVGYIIHECLLFSWPIIKKTIMLEMEYRTKKKCQTLLRSAKNLFSQVASLDKVLETSMRLAKELTNALFCNILMIDVDKMELYESLKKPNAPERRFPLNVGVAGEVVRTGKLINMQESKKHPSFDPNIDSLANVELRNLICLPIREQGGIIGVLILLNKRADPFFDTADEEMALAFSIYCGVTIMHSLIYQKMQEAHTRMALTNELVLYHMKVPENEVTRILECTGFHNHPHLTSLFFNHRALPLRELPCYAVKMFCDIGFDRRFNIKKTKLISMILQAKKGYRDVPYHNWLHAFNVLQWAYAATINYKLLYTYFNDLQGLMFFVAALMHDLDHRGTTSCYQIQGETTLAALYSSEGSVMERHHLIQAMCILNTEGCDILESFSRRDYDKALLLLKDFILATDLGNFFKNKNDYTAIAIDFKKGNQLHIRVLSNLLMNCADLSDQLKDWGNVKKTAALVLAEFFKQSDEERNQGEIPLFMIDKNKCLIPELEIQFINFVCIPLFTIVSDILPRAEPCLKILESHIERWDGSKPVFAEVPASAGISVLLSPELDTLIDLNIKEKEERERELARLAAEEQEEEK